MDLPNILSPLALVVSAAGFAVSIWATQIGRVDGFYAHNMAHVIKVRNVPDTVHRTLKVRAARAGMSLADYLMAELLQICERPTLNELRERLHRRAPVKLRLSAARAVRAQREAR
jgi:plasmid stability protein